VHKVCAYCYRRVL